MEQDTRNIRWVDIDSINPYYKNPRRNERAVEKIARSIQEFGFNQPIVVDQDNIIVVGHTRHKAAEHLKLTSVPVIDMPPDIDDANIKAYRIADNKLNELSEWNTDYLIDELGELSDVLDDLGVLGFDASELEQLLGESDDGWLLPDEQQYTPVFEIAVECADENEQEKLYIKLQKEGYQCRVLTM